jgi:hypothetical protein
MVILALSGSKDRNDERYPTNRLIPHLIIHTYLIISCVLLEKKLVSMKIFIVQSVLDFRFNLNVLSLLIYFFKCF